MRVPPSKRLVDPALLTAVVPAGALAVAASYAMATQGWARWGIAALPARTPAETSFGDLANITATADCLMAQLPIEGCDPYGRPFQPYVVLPARLLAHIGWGTRETGTLGVLLALCTILIVALLALFVARSWRRSLGGLWLAQGGLALVAVSPPVMLGIERGQLEQLTLAFVLLALALLSRPGPVAWLGAPISLAATASKYFSFGMFLPFVTQAITRTRRGAVVVAMTLSAAFVASHLPQLRQAAEAGRAATAKTSIVSFGLPTMMATMLDDNPLSGRPAPWIVARWETLHLIALAGFLLVATLSARALHQAETRLPSETAMMLILGGGGVLLLPYLLGSSHDYRLLFLLPIVAGCARWIGETGDARPPAPPVLLLVLGALAAWCGTWMFPSTDGLRGTKLLLVLGDVSLLGVLALVLALWARRLRPRAIPDAAGA